ncbi:MAG: hypothetical protein H8E17_19125 [Deltaproteobacteria bacterium]|nr:hypothetical protein [Deltaproteobacteria bacterium]
MRRYSGNQSTCELGLKLIILTLAGIEMDARCKMAFMIMNIIGPIIK